MPVQKEPNRVAGLELGVPGLATARLGRKDARDEGAHPIGYLDETGRPQAWTGDEEAPYVKTVPLIPRIVNQNPAEGAEVPGLQAIAQRARVIEVFALDLRDQSQSPPTIYLQIFDSVSTPPPGTQPMLTAMPLCSTAGYEWAHDVVLVTHGLYVALSSTALTFTPLAASQEFSITARFLT